MSTEKTSCTIASHANQMETGRDTNKVVLLNMETENVTGLRGIQKNTVCLRCLKVIHIDASFQRV